MGFERSGSGLRPDSGLADLKTQIQEIKASIESLSAFRDSIGEVKDSLVNIVTPIKEMKGTIGDLYSTIEGLYGMRSLLEEIRYSSSKLENSTKELQTSINEVKNSFSAIGELRESIDGLKTQLGKIDTLETTTSEIKQTLSRATEVTFELDKLKETMGVSKDAIGKIMELLTAVDGQVRIITGVVGRIPVPAKPSKEPEEEKPFAVFIEEVLTNLTYEVQSGVPAHALASKMEGARDEIAGRLPTHPGIYEIGRWARRLKNYPPETPLNAGDMEELVKTIKEWRQRMTK